MQAGARNPNTARRRQEHANDDDDDNNNNDDDDDDNTTQQQPIQMQPGRASLTTPAPPTTSASLQRMLSTSSNQTTTTGTINMITMLSDHIQSKSLLKNGTDELVNEIWKVKYTKITSKDVGAYGAAMKMIKLTINDNKNDEEFLRKASVEGMSQQKINDGLNAIIKQAYLRT